MTELKVEERLCGRDNLDVQIVYELHTRFSTILWISTSAQATVKVSIELEKVWVWYVQVTYEDATSTTTTFRCLGDCINSYKAQSSITKLSVNINTLRVQKTKAGETSSLLSFPVKIQRRSSIGSP